jgi:hypothetical protein
MKEESGDYCPTRYSGEVIHLLGEWGFFDQPEPRIASFRWIAPVFRLLKSMRIFHFRQGETAG